MPGHDIIVIGGSAGSLEVIRRIVGDLPGDLPAAVFVVMHIPAGAPSMLPAILSSSGSLTAVSPVDGEFPHAGRIFVAPTDRHMLLEDDVVRVVFGPRHNRHRPAIDPLFDSAAQVHAGRVIAVILSGMLDDGAAGLANVHARGGLALVQDPQTAAFTSMPSRALDLVPSAERLRPERLAARISALARSPAGPQLPRDPVLARRCEGYLGHVVELERTQRQSVYACPDCSGVLWELSERGQLRYQCRIGHTFTAAGLLSEHDESVERALSTALRALEEHASLQRRVHRRMRSLTGVSEPLDRRIRDMESSARVIRDLLQNLAEPADPEISLPDSAASS